MSLSGKISVVKLKNLKMGLKTEFATATVSDKEWREKKKKKKSAETTGVSLSNVLNGSLC